MPSIWADYLDISEELEKVKGLHQSLSGNESGKLQSILEYLFSSDGKMLRAGFCILSAKFGKGSSDPVRRAAAAIELIHLATLVHDDIIDASPTRRGKPSLFALFSPAKSVLAGDYLLSRAFLLISELVKPDQSVYMAKAASVICKAEINQSLSDNGHFPTKREYFRRIAGKTAALFVLSFHAGAIEAECSRENIQRLRRIGYNLGMAFQITDDILDYAGSADKLGKPAGNDLRQKIYTLPLICSYEKEPSLFRSLLTKRGYSRGRVKRITQNIKKTNGFAEAEQFAEKYTKRAFREISKLPNIKAKADLKTLSKHLLGRSY
ncbi:MAG: polyprenyl synthetase family protein [Spirochaetia bacterium]